MPESNLESRMAGVEAWVRGHEDQCKERYNNILKGQEQFSEDLKDGLKTVHDRVGKVDERFRNRFVAALYSVITLLVTIVLGGLGWLLTEGFGLK